MLYQGGHSFFESNWIQFWEILGQIPKIWLTNTKSWKQINTTRTNILRYLKI